MRAWIAAAGLELEAEDDLVPTAQPGRLTVTIWTARDRRGARSERGAGEAS
jgi:hypothetical protein